MPASTDETVDPSCGPDIRLADALGPTVEMALKQSVAHEPDFWAATLFPVVLPAIRMAVAAALREMVQTMNQVLDESLSFRSWCWRFEAWRTGRPFGEVVLLRTLLYRVEQVLLIDRNTGLVLCSVTAPDITPQDTSQVSAMLTAIQDFIHDSFDVEKSAGIRELHVGDDFSLWIEQGPRAAIAAAVRGQAPAELRETLHAAVDLVHQEFGAELRQFQGDSSPFESCRDILAGCLKARYQKAAKKRKWKVPLCLAGLALLAGMWIGVRIHDSLQWNRAITALRRAPGILVMQGGRYGGSYFVEGLLDPLAEPPQRVIASQGVDPRRVSMRFHPYLSLDPPFVLERARMVLHPPGGVSMGLDRDTLTLQGVAPHAWILQARNTAGQLGMAGIREIRTADLEDRDLEALRAAIEGQSIAFAWDSSVVGHEQTRIASTVAAEARQWILGEMAIGRTPGLQVIGYADTSGNADRNRELSRDRAAHVAALLAAASVPSAMLQVVGKEASAAQPAAAAQQRKVVFHVFPGKDAAERSEAR